MPTDYACQAAAEQAARAIAPVCALLAPERGRPLAEDEAMPVVLRSYLGVDRSSGAGRRRGAQPPAVSASMGAAVLLLFLDGVRAELAGALPNWHGTLPRHLSDALGLPAAGVSGRQRTGGWQSTAELQKGAEDVLTALVGRARGAPVGPADLTARLALIEDVMCGALRRMAVPPDAAIRCAAELSAAGGSLFGV
ncbi:hypothetical protein ACFSL4_21160 [Streptomyces caeni]|uniref:TetR/AcrR family transcriptional regulator n=1 Tax=Streptomyces caeni TaxID=2307231 RepID=A0ABW4ITE0_9ACTN